MEGQVIFSGVKPVMWITSAEDQALRLVGKAAIVCSLFDEDKGESAVLEVDESDENLDAIGGEDQVPGSHWSNMMELQNGRRVAVVPSRNKNIQLTLQTIAEDRRRDVEHLIDEQEEIVRGIDSMERVVEALENSGQVSDRQNSVVTGTTTPAVTSAVDNKTKPKTGSAKTTSVTTPSKPEDLMNGDHDKKQPAGKRLVSPEQTKKTRLKNLAEAGIKQKQHTVSPATSEIYGSEDSSGGKAKGVVNKINAPFQVNESSNARAILNGEKPATRPKVLMGRRSPMVFKSRQKSEAGKESTLGRKSPTFSKSSLKSETGKESTMGRKSPTLFKPSQKGEAGKESSKSEIEQSEAKTEAGSDDISDKNGSTGVIPKKTSVEAITKTGVKTSAGKSLHVTSISASSVHDSLHPGAPAKTINNITMRLASPKSAKL